MIGLMVGSTNLPVRANFDSLMWPEHGAECVTAAPTKGLWPGRDAALPMSMALETDQGRPAAFVSSFRPAWEAMPEVSNANAGVTTIEIRGGGPAGRGSRPKAPSGRRGRWPSMAIRRCASSCVQPLRSLGHVLRELGARV